MNNTTLTLEAQYTALRKALLLHRNRSQYPQIRMSVELAEFINNDLGLLKYSDGAIVLDGCDVELSTDCGHWDVG